MGNDFHKFKVASKLCVLLISLRTGIDMLVFVSVGGTEKRFTRRLYELLISSCTEM